MFKFLLAPLAAACLITTVAPVSAQRSPLTSPKTITEAPSLKDSTSPGDPFFAFGIGRSDSTDDPTDTSSIPDQSSGGPSGSGSSGVDPTTTASTGKGGNGVDQACGADLGSLKKVRASAVRAVGYGDNVDVVPLCLDGSLRGMQANVEGLRAPISQNDTLMTALRSEGFDPSRVVGVVVAGQMVVLYVH